MSKQSIIRTTRKPRGKPFEKGNPGKPRGARNKTAAALEAMLEGQAVAITQTAIDKALAGDPRILRMVFERINGTRNQRTVSLDLPEINSAEDAGLALAALAKAVASGRIAPGEAADLGQLIEASGRALRPYDDIAKRLEVVEQQMAVLAKAEADARNLEAGLSENMRQFRIASEKARLEKARRTNGN